MACRNAGPVHQRFGDGNRQRPIVSATSLSGSAGLDMSLAGTGNLIATLTALTAGRDPFPGRCRGADHRRHRRGLLWRPCSASASTGGTLSVGAGATLGAASNSVTLASDTGISEAPTGSIVAQSISGTAPVLSLTGVNAIATLTNLARHDGAR